MPPKGVAIRFPPASGFDGSAVWQLPQSPASVSALPLAIISGDGSAAATALDAVHKTRVTRIAGPSHRCLRIGRSPVFGSIAKKADVTSFRCSIFPRHISKKRDGRRVRNCVLRGRRLGGQICGAAGLKTDIHWYLPAV